MTGELEQMSDSSYRMRFGDEGEVWARLQGSVTNWRLKINKAGRLSAPPTTIHLRRQTYSDWPALYLDEFSDVMELMIRLVH